MAKDLRSFLGDMRRADPTQLIEVREKRSCKYEVIALSELLEQEKKFPMVLYENVRNIHGQPGHRVLVNLYGDRARYPIAFGLPKEQAGIEPIRAYLHGMRNPLPYKVVPEKKAPVKEVILRGREVDLGDLPIVHHHQEDGGHYITQPLLSKDPETGQYNLAFHRTMYFGKNKTAVFLVPAHTFANMKKTIDRGRPFPIAHVIGHHPLVGWAAATRAPRDLSEIHLAGGLLGEPVRMVPSETWGKDFLVPADAEIIIEGEIIPGKKVKDGPFGEWTGYVGPGLEVNLAKVHAVTRRRDAILVTEPMGRCGLYGLYALPYPALYLQFAEQVYPYVKAIHFPRSGNGFASCYISIAKHSPWSEGEQKNVGIHLCFNYVKLIVLVDEDVDVFDEEEVWRAVILRCQASADVDIIRGLRGSLLDPSMISSTTHDAMVIDATWKLDRRIPTRASLPPEVLKRVRLRDYGKD